MNKIILISAICAICTQAQSQSWNLTGNAGTNSSTNFIGTTDNIAFKIRTKNLVRFTVNGSGKVGIGITSPVFKLDVKGGSINTDSVYRIGGNTVLSIKGIGNTFVGIYSGFSNTGGTANTAIGFYSLSSNTTGINNTAHGLNALASNTTGSQTTACGAQALFSNIAGRNATAVGYNAMLFANNSATTFINYNVATGYEALRGSTTPANNTGNYNTAFGYQTLWSNTTGDDNIANGYQALYSNTRGNSNIANGYQALYNNSSGSSNVANGYQALYNNTTGNDNTAIGTRALSDNTEGNNNTANGRDALGLNITGNDNTAIGTYTLLNNIYGSFNTANGSGALKNNSSGSYNTAIGYDALYSNTGGFRQTAVGYRAMRYCYNGSSPSYGNNNVAVGYEALRGSSNAANNTGYSNTALGYQTLFTNTTGKSNTASGFLALHINTTGSWNTAYGNLALSNNTSGNANTAIGYEALYFNKTGNRNTAIGNNSGYRSDSSAHCTFLGSDADQIADTAFNNSMALGKASRITASGQIRIGNSLITSIGGYEPWANLSDGRYKKNVQENVPGIEFINRLRPVTYTMDVSGLRKFLKENITVQEDTEEFHKMDAEEKKLIEQAVKRKEKIVYTGFVAQEVEASAKQLGYDFSGVDKPQNNNSLYGLRYAEFVVPLVKAAQEQQQIIENQQKQIDELKSMMQQISVSDKKETVAFSQKAYLEQNNPNPFSQNTMIKFYLPQSTLKAVLKVYSLNGVELKSFDAAQKGFNEIIIKANTLGTGVFVYTLLVDEKTIDTKQMIITNE